MSLLRIINVPRRGIGDATIGKLQACALKNGSNLFDIVSNPTLVKGLVGAVLSANWKNWLWIVFALMEMATVMPVENLLQEAMNRTGYLEELENEHTMQAQGRIDNLQELLSVAKEFAGCRRRKQPGKFSWSCCLSSRYR